jgi:hypothetical protein
LKVGQTLRLELLDKRAQFRSMCAEAGSCVRCEAMCDRAAVLSELNGALDAAIMFIGEAPGRKGADRTHVPSLAINQAGILIGFCNRLNCDAIKSLSPALRCAILARHRERTAAQLAVKSGTVPTSESHDRAGAACYYRDPGHGGA